MQGYRFDSLGQTNDSGELKVSVDGNEVLSSRVEELRLVWENAIPSSYGIFKEIVDE